MPLSVPFFDLTRQYTAYKSSFDTALAQIHSSGKYIGGEVISNFEKDFAAYHQAAHGVGVSNGTSALINVLRALGIGKGDEVITTAYSWIATANAISIVGAKPVFVDVSAETGLLDVTQIPQKITPKSKAIVPVHLYGQMADMASILQIANRHRLYVIEDAAQAHGASQSGRFPGQQSTAATFSFYPTKQLGAWGDAGIILTQNEQLALKCRKLANHGTIYPNRNFEEIGDNARLDALQATVLQVKLAFLMKWIDRRKAIAAMYQNELRSVINVKQLVIADGNDCSWYQFPIFTPDKDKLRSRLLKAGIETAIGYDFVLPKLKPYLTAEHFHQAHRLAEETITLPFFPELTDEEIGYVCEQIKKSI